MEQLLGNKISRFKKKKGLGTQDYLVRGGERSLSPSSSGDSCFCGTLFLFCDEDNVGLREQKAKVSVVGGHNSNRSRDVDLCCVCDRCLLP